MDVLLRSPKRRNRIEPRNRPGNRCHMEHTSRYHIMSDACRGDETPGSEISGQASINRGSRRTRLERAQQGKTSAARCRTSPRASQKPRALQEVKRLRNQERGPAIDSERRLRARRILYGSRRSRGNTIVAGKMKALTSGNFVNQVQRLKCIGS